MMYVAALVDVSLEKNIQKNIDFRRLIMPGMLRPKGKARRIAYKILGVPANLQSKRTPEEKKINRRLIYEETWRSR